MTEPEDTEEPMVGTLCGELPKSEIENGKYEYVEKLQPAAIPPTDACVWYTYVDGLRAIHYDEMQEHVSQAIIVEETGRTVLYSRSGILWFDHFDRDVDDQLALEAAISLSDTSAMGFEGDTTIECPDEFSKAVSGWHDSMFPSSQSEKMNMLAKGDVPSEWSSDVFPYIVFIGDTKNCCSVNASIYAKEAFHCEIQDSLKGSRPRPAYAGFGKP